MVGFYVKYGSIYNKDGIEITDPAMLIDGDCLYKVGNYSIVESRFNKLISSFSGMSPLEREDMSKDIKLIRLSKGYSRDELMAEDIAYIFNRALYFTGTFVEKLGKMWGTPDFYGWLKSEEERLPVKVENE